MNRLRPLIKIIISLTALCMVSCFESSRSKQKSSSFAQKEFNVQLDSVPFTEYQYVDKARQKSANGDKVGAIEDYTRAIMVAIIIELLLRHIWEIKLEL